MNDSLITFPLLVSESPVAVSVLIPGLFEFSVFDGSGRVSCHFSPTHSPTHSPNPSLAPPGERGEHHVAASVKVGNLVIEGTQASKWPQRRHEALNFVSAQLQLATQWPQRRCGLPKSMSAQRQQTVKCLQLIEKPRTQFDGSAPLCTFFPPSKTRPHVAVSSLSAPAGVERVGERGGIQRLKNKNAADNRFGSSTDKPRRVREILLKQEQTMYIERGLTVKITKKIGQFPQTVTKDLSA